jgi:glycosyltransferase involved in cell wall biosynthesis
VKLSIITINLNNDTGLKKTIESVINQTLRNFEFIIIDGGSTDRSVELIKEYAGQINYYVSEPDRGIYNAMNKGIQQAHGEYCFFLNSGDYFVNERVLEKVFSDIFNEDVVFGNLIVLLNGNIVGKSRGKEKLTFNDIYSSLLKHQASFIRRQLFDKSGLYNEDLKITADWEFFIKTVGLGGATYRYLDIDISCFDNNGISNNSSELVSDERKAIIKKYIPSMMQPDYEYLLNYGEYRILTKLRLTNLLLRVLTKIVKMFNKVSQRK